MKRILHARWVAVLVGAVVCALVLSTYGATVASAVSPSSTYDQVAFSDGFESGLGAWTPTGPGSASATSAAARSGSSGLRLSNTSGQFIVVQHAMTVPLIDSSISFWVRIGSAAGVQEIAETRDQANSAQMWVLLYDGNQHGFWFYPRDASHATEIFTGSNTAALNTWVQVEVQYTATASGGAQLYINGQTQAAWGVSGNYTRTTNLQKVQIWNDAANTVDFDDVTVAVPAGSVATPPGAPTAVTGTPGDSQVSLSWTAPASNGGSPITGYRITPYIGSAAQAPTTTTSAATTANVTGLTNGTAYTFKVAATNAIGTGSDSAGSAAVTPTAAAATAPGRPPAAPTGTPGDGQVALTWSAPTSDGGSAITGYRVTPYIAGVAQTPILTGSPATNYTVTGLTNGTSYTFTVAAINNIGTGPDSVASLAITPTVGRYSSVVFSDGFESGSLGAWPGGNLGSGTASVTAAAARHGSFGLRLTNTTGQYSVLVKTFSSPLVDSQASFWVRVGSAAGIQELAQARDTSSSQIMWTLYYDGGRHGFWFYPTNGAGTPTELFTGINSVQVGGWHKIAIQYTAVTSGGAQLYVDGQTQASWGVSADYSRTAHLQKLQIWNDAVNTVDFDDIRVAIPSSQPAGLPGAPTNVTGLPDDSKVNLSWTAPTVDGGGIIGYRVTPYVGTVAQTPIETGSPATSYLVTGLTNGTAYTFTVAAESATGTGSDSPASTSITPAVLNAIQRENNLQGDPNWGNFNYPASATALSAYGSRISVNHGQSIGFYATTTASTLTLDIFRMGWYNGAGARRVQSMGNYPGVNQPQALPNATTGMISENWTRTATLAVPSSWTTGVYLARFLAPDNTGTFVVFVVRNDGGHEPIVFQTSVNTYQAYNEYGGTSLYANRTNHSIYTGPHATKVSFDRPFANGNGAGDFLRFEYPFVRWLEKVGYDVTYTTDTDTSTNVNPLTNHKVFLCVGHDEYWSKGMRDNVEAAIAAHVNAAFFGGNEAYWQVRYEPNTGGTPNRVLVGYKDFANDPTAPGPDPMWNVNNSVLTTLWRDSLVNRPEEQMMGVMFGGEVLNNDMIIQNASHWVYAGTGWTNGTHVPAIVGYEYDHFWNDTYTPPNVTVLSNSPLTNTENGQADTANSTIYTAPSGAMVFAAGTIQWSWGLDSSGGGQPYVNAGLQRTTANILARFTQ